VGVWFVYPETRGGTNQQQKGVLGPDSNSQAADQFTLQVGPDWGMKSWVLGRKASSVTSEGRKGTARKEHQEGVGGHTHDVLGVTEGGGGSRALYSKKGGITNWPFTGAEERHIAVEVGKYLEEENLTGGG